MRSHQNKVPKGKETTFVNLRSKCLLGFRKDLFQPYKVHLGFFFEVPDQIVAFVFNGEAKQRFWLLRHRSHAFLLVLHATKISGSEK